MTMCGERFPPLAARPKMYPELTLESSEECKCCVKFYFTGESGRICRPLSLLRKTGKSVILISERDVLKKEDPLNVFRIFQIPEIVKTGNKEKLGDEKMEERELPVAVFDSGVGGISVLRELVRSMPSEHFVYFGDSANAPYGTRPTEEVRKMTLARIGELITRGAKAVVIACNTATSAAIGDLRRAYPNKIIIGVEPAVKLAAEMRPQGRILVMATDVTLRERKFRELTARFSQAHPVAEVHCPGLVERIEAGQGNGPQMEEYLRETLIPHLTPDTAAIVLGCTHYPFVRKSVETVAGPGIAVIDGGAGTARETRRRLAEAGLLRMEGKGEVTLENSCADPQLLARMKQLLETE